MGYKSGAADDWREFAAGEITKGGLRRWASPEGIQNHWAFVKHIDVANRFGRADAVLSVQIPVAVVMTPRAAAAAGGSEGIQWSNASILDATGEKKDPQRGTTVSLTTSGEV